MTTRRITVNGRMMEMKLKIGWTPADFARHFGCSEQEFIDAVKKNFSEKASKGMLERLEQNQKRLEKAKKAVQRKTVVVPAQKAETVEVEKSLEENEKTIEAVEVPEEAEVEEKQTPEAIKQMIDEFKAKEESVRQEICNLEASRVALIAERGKKKEKLQKYYETMLNVRVQLQKIEQEINKTLEEIDYISEKLADANENIGMKEEMLGQIKKDIEDMNKMSVYIYKTGEVEVDGPVEFVVPDTWESIFKEMATCDEAEELTIKQIKLLAKVMAFVKTLGDIRFEVSFEMEEVQQVFEMWQQV